MHKPIAVVSFGCRSSTLPTEFSPNYVYVRGSEWGLVFSVICPFFLVFTVKLAIFLMFTVLEKNTV